MIALSTEPSAVGILSQSDARDLTARIRSTAENLCQLLFEAHEGKAYQALGYDTWAAYVAAEFSMSRTHSHALLAQAAVIRVLEEAAGEMSCAQDISARAAQEIRPSLPRVAEAVRTSVEQGTPPREAVRRAIEGARPQRREEPPPPSAASDPDDSFDVAAASADGGNGRVTRKAVERVERERAPEPPQEDAPDVAGELERAHAEIDQLNSVIDSLNRSDASREIVSLNAKFAQLNGRLQQEMTTAREAKQQAERYGAQLKRIRTALGVSQNADILPAIEALKG